MGVLAGRIETKLQAAFAPLALEVRDDSQRHRGHAGWQEGGETHFHVSLVSRVFEGLGRVERHRLVNSVLAEELAGRVHALSLRLLTPQENDRVQQLP
jgi:BolA protein